MSSAAVAFWNRMDDQRFERIKAYVNLVWSLTCDQMGVSEKLELLDTSYVYSNLVVQVCVDWLPQEAGLALIRNRKIQAIKALRDFFAYRTTTTTDENVYIVPSLKRCKEIIDRHWEHTYRKLHKELVEDSPQYIELREAGLAVLEDLANGGQDWTNSPTVTVGSDLIGRLSHALGRKMF